MDDNYERLIDYVRQFPVIYNPKCTEYKDQAMRSAVWEEIGEKLKQPAEKCKDDWNRLRNAYVNARKRRKIKCIEEPWKYEQQMKFLIPYMKSRSAWTNVQSPLTAEYAQTEPFLEESQLNHPAQSESRSESPVSCSSHTNKRHKSNDLYDFMKSSHEMRIQKELSMRDIDTMDETDLFFLSMSKTVKKLPKIEQAKLKLDLHTAVAEVEIRYLNSLVTQPQQDGQSNLVTITKFDVDE